MRARSISNVLFGLTIVLIAYGTTQGQVISTIKGTTEKTVKKTVEVTKDVAGKTKDVVETGSEKSVEGGKAVGSKATKIGSYSVDVTENVVGTAYEGGRWLTVKTWDGTKWVSKRAWFKTKKVSGEVKKAVIDQD